MYYYTYIPTELENTVEYMQIKAAADKATDAWLNNDSAENFAAMRAANDLLEAAKAAGLNVITLSEKVVDGMMARSVFGTVDRIRAARTSA